MSSTALKVAALGREPTYSTLAAGEMTVDLELDDSYLEIRDVVASVDSGDALVGVVPLRNTTSGVDVISDTEDALREFPDVEILVRREIPIHIALVAQEGVLLEEIEVIVSKPQALGQIRGWLGVNLPEAAIDNAASTSAGLDLAQADRRVAVAGVKDLADEPGMTLLAESIQDEPDNRTEFAVIVNPRFFQAE